MAGHVFLVRGHPGDLACDDAFQSVQHLAATKHGLDSVDRSSSGSPGLNLGTIQQFLDQSTRRLTRGRRRLDRAKSLVAIPLGPAEHPSELLTDLLSVLLHAVRDSDLDVVAVAPDPATFAAAQALRRSQVKEFWTELPGDLCDQAKILAGYAYERQLALFIGAGVSAGAGLPLLNELLERLAEKAGMSGEEQDGLRRLNPLDQAAVVEKRLGGNEGLSAALRDLFAAEKYSLSHALLAGLPVREAVTTNYDQLFEQAWEAIERRPLVLPYRAQNPSDGWLLKLHGCVSHPQEIVLTRADQIGFNEQHAALAGLVEALLITRHMLFVGFSMNDDNFHRIATSVRRVVRKPSLSDKEVRPFGTALVLKRNNLLEELWGEDLQWVGMIPSNETSLDEKTETAHAARLLDIFLDYLVAQVPNEGHLLDDRFRQLLTPEEAELRERLLQLTTELPDAAFKTSAWDQIRSVLCKLGYQQSPRTAHELQRKS